MSKTLVAREIANKIIKKLKIDFNVFRRGLIPEQFLVLEDAITKLIAEELERKDL